MTLQGIASRQRRPARNQPENHWKAARSDGYIRPAGGGRGRIMSVGPSTDYASQDGYA